MNSLGTMSLYQRIKVAGKNLLALSSLATIVSATAGCASPRPVARYIHTPIYYGAEVQDHHWFREGSLLDPANSTTPASVALENGVLVKHPVRAPPRERASPYIRVDVDANGKEDLLEWHDDQLYVVLQNPDGSFSRPRRAFEDREGKFYSPDEIEVFDGNHDGTPDLRFTYPYADPWRWWITGMNTRSYTAKGNRDGTFQYPVREGE